ncbi:MAG: hypothetical protein GC202_00885 [Alphaproteobacteria bacterium]|nr:hypothetical protein [Alphaproteobacteria bacterium]
MKKTPDPKADMYVAKAKRFRQRALGFRHTLARDDLTRAHRLELEQMVTNLEGAARQLERMAGGEKFDVDAELTEVRTLKAGGASGADAAAARFMANARKFAAAKGAGGTKAAPAPSRMAPRSAKFARRDGR